MIRFFFGDQILPSDQAFSHGQLFLWSRPSLSSSLSMTLDGYRSTVMKQLALCESISLTKILTRDRSIAPENLFEALKSPGLIFVSLFLFFFILILVFCLVEFEFYFD